jgi:hypothetical protein
MEFENRSSLPFALGPGHAVAAALLWGVCLAAAMATDTPPASPSGQRPLGMPPPPAGSAPASR